MFKKIGFFHFGVDHANPAGALQSALLEAGTHEDICQSLIVLPEAFNIGKFYRNQGGCNYNPIFLSTLQTISQHFFVTFVAGLIIHENASSRPPYSSAWLIDGSHHLLMCYKAEDDGSKNYTPCTNNNDIANPIQYNETYIAALICMDVQAGYRCGALKGIFEAACCPCKIVCIPACMSMDYFGGGKCGYTAQLATVFGNVVIVVANSDPSGCRSFITDAQGIITHSFGGNGNRIVLKPLDEAMDT
jgi:predicted amidohydrolase